jgi:methionine synthase II (cobalamin-independent)
VDAADILILSFEATDAHHGATQQRKPVGQVRVPSGENASCWTNANTSRPTSVGPGAYDVHSPRIADWQEIAQSLRTALKAVPAQRLWVNQDCGRLEALNQNQARTAGQCDSADAVSKLAGGQSA